MQETLVTPRIAVISPQGHLNAANVDDLQQQLGETISSQEYFALLVDMARVESLDSSGLMAFISTLSLAKCLDKRFGLCSVTPSVRIVFELTCLDQAFEIFEHRTAFEAALA